MGRCSLTRWGEPLPYWRWKRLPSAATTETGVDATAHGFRHFAASALIAGGASVKQAEAFFITRPRSSPCGTSAYLWPGDEGTARGNVLDAAPSPLADSLRTEAVSDA